MLRHLADGALRRLHDDRVAGSNAERAHLDRCARCRTRLDAVAADAALASRLLAGRITSSSLTDAALARLRGRLGDPAPVMPGLPRRRPAVRRWAVASVLAVTVTGGLVATAGAAGWLSIFSPTEVAPVVLTAGDISGLPDLRAYGRVHVTPPPTTVVAGPGEAATASGLPPLTVANLPSSVPSSVSWTVYGATTATFTLTAANAPASLQGTTITVHGGPAVLGVYGAHDSVTAGNNMGIPSLVVGETAAPTASTEGATLEQLEGYLLAQPGISPALAAEIRAIGQPGSTLPVPVVSGFMSSTSVTIDGVQGVLVGDSTGLGAGVVWEKAGVVYAVGGLLTQDQVLAIARSLR